jgi:MipA family protein
MKPMWTVTAVGAVTLLCAAQAVHAQDAPVWADGPIEGRTEVLLGLSAGHQPVYLGSDERKTRALPLLAARWSNGWFAGTSGIGYRFNAGQPLSGGLRLSLDRGRDENDADALRGMGDIDMRPEIGGFVDWALLPGLRLGSSLRYGSGNDHDGLLADVGLRGMLPLSSSIRLTAGLTATFANTKAMQSQFGVDALQSANSGYALYTPGSGLRDVSLQAGSMFRLRDNLMLFVGANARTLMGDARDSPLTRDRTGVGAIATLAFRL